MGDPFQDNGGGEVKEDWLVTYADAITILMAFFVMMFSISEPSPEKFEEVAGGILAEIKGKDAAQKMSPFMMMSKDANTAIEEMKEKNTEMSSSSRGMSFNFDSADMFKPGAAELKEQAHEKLDRVAQLVTLMGVQNYMVEVEGHTDDIPIATKQFPSNWELSSSRAAAVVRFLISRGVDRTRMMAIGMSDTQPKAPNRDEGGQSIPENQAANRRVVIRIER